MISAILPARGDETAADGAKRLALCLNGLALQVDLGAGEVLFVDGATPDHLPTAPETIWDSLTATARRRLRILRVREAQREEAGPDPRLREAVARNVAARRSNPANRWILSTSGDVIVADLGGARLARALERQPDALYTLPATVLPESCWRGFDRRDPVEAYALAAAWRDELRLGSADAAARVGAAAPFLIAPRAALLAIGGFEEEPLDERGLHWNLGRRLALRLGAPRSLGDRFALYRLGDAVGGPRAAEPDAAAGAAAPAFEPARPEAWHAGGAWGLAGWRVETIRLDVAPGETVRAAGRRAIEALGAADGPAAPDRFDRFAGDAGALAARVLDALNPLPRGAVLTFAGVRRDMFGALLEGLSALGFEKRLLIPESVAERLGAAGRAAAQIAPDEAALERADALVFAFGLIRDETGTAPAEGPESAEETAALDAVAGLLAQAARSERRRALYGATARLFVVANASDSRFERDVEALIPAAPDAGATRLHGGLLRADGAAAPGGIEAGARRWLAALAAGRPLSRRERLEVAARGDAIAERLRSASASDATEDTLARMRRAFAECRAPHPALDGRLAPAGPAGLSGVARADAWEDAAWRSDARRLAPPGAPRTGWVWERAQILHGLRAEAPPADGRVLFVCEHPEPLVALVAARLAAPVDVADVRAFFGEPGELAEAVDPTSLAEGGYRAVIAPHAALFRHGVTRSADALAQIRPLLRAGGMLAIGGETALIGPERAMRPPPPSEAGGGFPGALATHLALTPLGLGATTPRPEDAALVATRAELEDATSALGLLTGGDVLWPAVWFFRAEAEAGEPDAAALTGALSDLQLGDLAASLSLAAGAERDAEGGIRGPATAGREGHALYGPYLRLAPGAYTATLTLGTARRRGARRSEVAVEVALGETITAQRRRPVPQTARETEIAIDFTAPAGAPPFELRLWTDGACDYRVSAASIRRARPSRRA